MKSTRDKPEQGFLNTSNTLRLVLKHNRNQTRGLLQPLKGEDVYILMDT